MSPIIISTVQDDLIYWQEINIDNWRFQKEIANIKNPTF